MTEVYKSNNHDLADLRGRLDGLNGQMDTYLETIRMNADRYRHCT